MKSRLERALIYGSVLVIVSCFHTFHASGFEFMYYSKIANDSFIITVSAPPDASMDTTRRHKLFLYTDATISSGQRIRQLTEDSKYQAFSMEYLQVGIGHTGNIRMKRRRDLIPPDTADLDDAGFILDSSFAHADRFKRVLLDEVIPMIHAKFRIREDSAVYCGHSFGGVFGLFLMADPTSPFSEYLLLSPSIWANRESIYGYIGHLPPDQIFVQRQNFPVLHVHVGGFERVNIVPDAKRFELFLNQNGFQDFSHHLTIHRCTGHHGIITRGFTAFLNN